MGRKVNLSGTFQEKFHQIFLILLHKVVAIFPTISVFARVSSTQNQCRLDQIEPKYNPHIFIPANPFFRFF